MQHAFSNNHFSSVAARFSHYKVLLKSMEVLQVQSQNLWSVVHKKSEHINTLESDLKQFKKRLQTSLKSQVIEYKQLRQNDLDETNWKISSEQKVLTPFYIYMKSHLSKKQAEYPSMSYLETVAAM